jgi:hypothetical protein
LVLGLGDGLVAAPDQRLEELGRFGRLGVGLGCVRELADDRQDRPFDRTADGAVRLVGGPSQGARDCRRVNLVALAELLGRAANDLREDHTRVAARAHQRRARKRMGERGAVVARGRAVEGLRDPARREQHVRARVAVGHGIDVEVVDPLPAPLERGHRAADEQAQRFEIAHGSKLRFCHSRVTHACALRG